MQQATSLLSESRLASLFSSLLLLLLPFSFENFLLIFIFDYSSSSSSSSESRLDKRLCTDSQYMRLVVVLDH